MKNQLFKLAFIALAFAGITLQSCDDDDGGTDPVVEDFVPDNTTFADWANWELVAEYDEPGPSLGEAAHGGQDTNFVRKVYAPTGNSMAGGEYTEGSLFFKQVTNKSTNTSLYFAMAKRNAEFDENGWEWFILGEDGSINTADGEALRGGSDFKACQSCHAGASTKDFVFTD